MTQICRITHNRLHIKVAAAFLAAMIPGALSAYVSYAQVRPETVPTVSDSVISPLRFDVVSVKVHAPDTQGTRMQLTPDGVRLSNVRLQDLMVQAYGLVLNDQVVGLPSWAESQRFDIEAKVADGDIAAFRKLSLDQIRSMARPILVERFKFVGHQEKRTLPLYALVVAKGGSRLKPSTLEAQDAEARGIARTGLIEMHHASNANGAPPSLNELTAHGVTMDRLASTLSQQGLGRVVLDSTGLTDRYDFKLSWASDSAAADADSPATSGPSIFTAVSEQLGLKLEPRKGPVSVLVTDHIEMPATN